ncbi:hypothetical protein [Micromonospora narathiwatensis]|uniref:WD40-like Beta Propeller Repeat n=1 Tax=Micromonospora narathiwatensis TaxID=299146 RepID=A0A1A9AD64_9ACTN|nr:hypothetical protein [Micromonospora narathiwatensis]SBT54450.1 hypothetical protein GA0070621_5435 [Micromonospora narathiwatensis]
MNELRELLHTKAAEVPCYDVGGQVLRAARRRRRVVLGAPVATLAGVLAVVGVVAATAPFGGDVPIVAADRPALAVSLPWLPATVGEDDGKAAPLPTNRGVGAGSVLYARCALPCAPRLITEDGREYELPGPETMPPAAPRVPTLSPDGRWLSYPDAGGRYVLRDLTDARTVPTGTRRVVGWSADSRWAALADADDEDVTALLSAADAREVPVTLPADEQRPLAGLTRDGGVVFGPTEARANDAPVDLRIIDAAGATRTVRVDTSDLFGPDEELSGGPVLAADGTTVLFQVMRVRDGLAAPGDLVRVDLADGSVRARFRLPVGDADVRPGRTDGGHETGPTGGQHRSLVSALAEGAVLVHYQGPPPHAVEVLDLRSGDREVITSVADGVVWLRVRGQTV